MNHRRFIEKISKISKLSKQWGENIKTHKIIHKSMGIKMILSSVGSQLLDTIVFPLGSPHPSAPSILLITLP